jgi:hypothetical protein
MNSRDIEAAARKYETEAQGGGASSDVNDLNDAGVPSGVSTQSVAASEARKLLGQDLSAIFKDQGIHPVVIFGSSGAGKSSFIASLLRYAKRYNDSGLSLEFGEEIFPTEDARWKDMNQLAQYSFFTRDQTFADGNVLPADGGLTDPYFIPVKLTCPDKTQVSFAFLEGKGEWYQPDYSKTNPVQPFQAMLTGFLEQFNSPITAIFLAPFNIEEASVHHITGRLRESDQGLAGAIQEYSKSRRALMGWDKQIFLLTKWDVFCKGIVGDEFADPNTDDVINLLRERFPDSWGKFLGVLPSGRGENQKVAPYCAGVISGSSVLTPAIEDRWLVDLYARRVWNQLHKDATKKALFSDLEPSPEGLLDKFVNWLRGK